MSFLVFLFLFVIICGWLDRRVTPRASRSHKEGK
jgi:hypothetical protein